MTEPKPCPCCGYAVVVAMLRGLECVTCGLSIQAPAYDEALRRWNARPDTLHRATVAGLVARIVAGWNDIDLEVNGLAALSELQELADKRRRPRTCNRSGASVRFDTCSSLSHSPG